MTHAGGGRVLAHLVRPLAPWPLHEPVHGRLGRLGQALQEGAVVLCAVDRGGCCGACSLLWGKRGGGLGSGLWDPRVLHQCDRDLGVHHCPKTLHPYTDGSCTRRKSEVAGGLLTQDQ